jgi:pimeloyl-ACP methyl ester carboxylesterase
LVDGPWSHSLIAANGARFHVAECGASDDPLVLFLHGFPEFWWAWRHQLPVVAAAGYRAVAMDLRGYGASDKTPRGYDPHTAAADVSGMIRSLGATDAVVVGHGWGGFIGWSAAVFTPRQVRGSRPCQRHIRFYWRGPV